MTRNIIRSLLEIKKVSKVSHRRAFPVAFPDLRTTMILLLVISNGIEKQERSINEYKVITTISETAK